MLVACGITHTLRGAKLLLVSTSTALQMVWWAARVECRACRKVWAIAGSLALTQPTRPPPCAISLACTGTSLSSCLPDSPPHPAVGIIVDCRTRYRIGKSDIIASLTSQTKRCNLRRGWLPQAKRSTEGGLHHHTRHQRQRHRSVSIHCFCASLGEHYISHASFCTACESFDIRHPYTPFRTRLSAHPFSLLYARTLRLSTGFSAVRRPCDHDLDFTL